MPIASYEGRKPIAVVPVPMMPIVRRNVYFLPTRSPILPKTTAPKGLTAKPVAKTARVDKNAMTGSPGGKNLVDSRTLKEPKM